MRRLATSARIFLLLSACCCLGSGWLCQGALAYSVKDDVEAARAYQAKPGHNVSAAGTYQQAVDLLVKCKFREARPLLEQVIKWDPRLTDAYSSYGYCLTALGLYKQGAEALAIAIGIDSDKPIYFYRKALCYFSTGQRKEAVGELTHSLGKKPGDADVLRLRARCHRASHEFNDAIADFDQLIKMNAFLVESLCERGRMLNQTGAYDKALQDFDAALKINPNEGKAYAGRAEVFFQQHQYRAAADNYTAAYVCGTDMDEFCVNQRDICLQYLKTKGPQPPVTAGGKDLGNRPK